MLVSFICAAVHFLANRVGKTIEQKELKSDGALLFRNKENNGAVIYHSPNYHDHYNSL